MGVDTGTTERGDERRARLRRAHARFAAVARRQYGLVTASQAAEAGLGRNMLGRLVARGLVERRFRGVYVLAGAPDRRELRWLAAQLAVGGDAVLSHRTAASVHGMDHGLPLDAVHLSVPGRVPRSRPGIVLHSAPGVDVDGVVRRGPLLVTSTTRTLGDLAGELRDQDRLRVLVAQAVRRGDTDPGRLRALLARRPRARGWAGLRAIVDELAPLEAATRGELESRFLHITTAGGVPPTAMNHPIVDGRGRRRLLDAVWLPLPVYAELDSRAHHGTLVDWHDDLRRENAVALAGFRWCLRFSWHDLVQVPDLVVDTVRDALAHAAAEADRGGVRPRVR